MNNNNESTTSTIKFNPATVGELDFNSGPSSFGDLFMLGAFAATKTIKYSPDGVWYEYPTDQEGMKNLEGKSYEVIQTLSNTITSLGMMLAYVDRGEVGDSHLRNYAWLITGLGELLSTLVHENQEITNSILVTSKQP